MFTQSLRRRKVLLAGVCLFIAVLVTGVLFVLSRTKSGEVCPVTPATQQDLDVALAIGKNVFEPEQWELKYGENQGLISVGWFNHQNGALAHSQYIMYNCGYTEADLAGFYGPDGLKIMLGGYDSWTQTAVCERDGITLREFDVVYVGTPYKSRFWAHPLNDTRVQDMRLDFAAQDQGEMDTYAAQLFPNFKSCAAT